MILLVNEINDEQMNEGTHELVKCFFSKILRNVEIGRWVGGSGRNSTSDKKSVWPYLDNDGLPEALDCTKKIVSARSSFLALSPDFW